MAIFCVSFPLGGCFLWLLLVVSLVEVVVASRWRGGGKVGSGFFFFGTGFLGFSFLEQGFWVFLRGVHFVG